MPGHTPCESSPAERGNDSTMRAGGGSARAGEWRWPVGKISTAAAAGSVSRGGDRRVRIPSTARARIPNPGRDDIPAATEAGLSVHRGFRCKLRSRFPGREDPRCSGRVSGTSAGRGCSTRVWTRRERQRREARQGAIRIFWEIPIPPSSSPARRRLPAASAPEPAFTNTRCASWRSLGPRETLGVFRRMCARGESSRDRASGEAGMVGCGVLRRERCSKKNADGPLARFHLPAVPDIPREAQCAPPLPTRRTRCRAW
jgi:hypothetical protein